VDDESFEVQDSVEGAPWRRELLPVVAAIVAVGIITGLVLAGLIGTGGRHDEPAAPTTTVPTIQLQL
jgi:hypothetical protein